MKNKRSSIRNKLAAMAVGAVALGSTGAQATIANGIVDQWTVSVVGNFLCSSAAYTGTSTNNNCDITTMNWGSNGTSGLDIVNSPAAVVDTNGAAVSNMALTHRNQPIDAPSLDSVSLRSTLTLTPFAPSGGSALPVYTLDFLIDFMETPNNDSTCADGGAQGVGMNINGCGDIFVIDKESLNFPFFYDIGLGEKTYFISFFEETGGLGTLSNAACTSAGVANGCRGFVTPEDANTTFNFAAIITTEPVVVDVPVPGTLASMGLGLLLLGFRRRRA